MNHATISVNGHNVAVQTDQALTEANLRGIADHVRMIEGPQEVAATPAKRTIRQVAIDITRQWTQNGKQVHYAALPYLRAMRDENYGADGAKSVVLYFLGNATTFRGVKARALKAELKALIGVK